MRIVEALCVWSPYFRLRRDAFSKVGLSPLQKCTVVIRMLAYGSPVDLMDETFEVAESTTMECLIHFVHGVRSLFGAQYLRKPTSEDIQRLLQVAEQRGFLGSWVVLIVCIGSGRIARLLRKSNSLEMIIRYLP